MDSSWIVPVYADALAGPCLWVALCAVACRAQGCQHSGAIAVKPFTVCFEDLSGAGAAAFACAAASLRSGVCAIDVAAASTVFDAALQRIGA